MGEVTLFHLLSHLSTVTLENNFLSEISSGLAIPFCQEKRNMAAVAHSMRKLSPLPHCSLLTCKQIQPGWIPFHYPGTQYIFRVNMKSFGDMKLKELNEDPYFNILPLLKQNKLFHIMLNHPNNSPENSLIFF